VLWQSVCILMNFRSHPVLVIKQICWSDNFSYRLP